MTTASTTHSDMSSHSSVAAPKNRNPRRSRHNVLVDDAAPWLSAPINVGADWTPLGVPTTTVVAAVSKVRPNSPQLVRPTTPTTTTATSPSRGSAVSRARWSTTVPVTVQSVRHRKKNSHNSHAMATTTAADATGARTLGSSDSDKEQRPPVVLPENGTSSIRAKSERGGVQSRDPSPVRRPGRHHGQSSSVRQVDTAGPVLGWATSTTPPMSPRSSQHRSASSTLEGATNKNRHGRHERPPCETPPDAVLLPPPTRRESRHKRRASATTSPPTDQITVTASSPPSNRGRSASRPTVATPVLEVVTSRHNSRGRYNREEVPVETSTERSRSSSRPRPLLTAEAATAAAPLRSGGSSRRSSSQPPRPAAAAASIAAQSSRERSTSRTRPASSTTTTASERSRGRSSSSSSRHVGGGSKGGATRSRSSSSTRTSQSLHPRSSRPSAADHHHRSRSASLTRMAASPSAAHASSASFHRPHQRPPSTYRTRQELRGHTKAAPSSRNSGGTGGNPSSQGSVGSHGRTSPMPRHRSQSESDVPSLASTRSWKGWNHFDLTLSNGGSSSGAASGPLLPDNGKSKHKRATLLEKLFGDSVEKPNEILLPSNQPQQSMSLSNGYRMAEAGPQKIRPRILLAATVYHNTATNLWIATINTNQRGVAKNPATANKFLKAFSFATEREARESAIANAPPKMMPFSESPLCFGCHGKFAVFRRAAHCRNCGVCVCSSCSTSWPMKMIPATYNLKHESAVKICRTCHSLHVLFKRALLHGDWEEAIGLYETGNVNLRTPFAVSNKKEEVMHPVHCAAEGGNLHLLRWLTEEHFCPITVHNTKAIKRGGGGNFPDHGDDTSILTSKGRSVLSIAMENLKVDMMRYLVVERSVSVYECKDVKSALAALEAALTTVSCPTSPYDIAATSRTGRDIPSFTRWDRACFDDASETSSLGEDDGHFYNQHNADTESVSRRSRTNTTPTSSINGGGGAGAGECIICFDRKINSVATPCGHQVCCLECCSTLTSCPVCNGAATFIKIFRP
jgi:FYVE zinc finger/Zinc finger, C3HC4 type (RING finger)